jgi:hypothetical protein
MPDDTTILSLPLILPAQAQKHVTHNEALVALDLIVQLAVINRTLAAPPALPSLGDRHIVAAGATGPWAGQAGRIALFSETGWQFTQALPGWRAHVLAEGQTAVFDGLAWKTQAEGPLTVTQLGIAATADAVNRLAVASPATLLNHAGSGHQLKLNKAGSADTASLLFQTGFSGRAEMGTAGTDDFAVKVSADGATWFTALEADAGTGEVTLPQPLRLGGQAGDPVGPADGTLWLNTSSGEVKVRSGGLTLPVGGGGGVADGDKGDITVSGGGATWTIDPGAVTLAKLAGIATGSFLGRDTAGTGAPEVLSPAQARGILNVAAGATANATDAALRDRATHTGSQTAATISNFAEAVDDRVAALVVAGANMTITYDDGAGTLTFAAASGSAGTDLSYAAATRLLASSSGADVTLPLVSAGEAGLAPASGGGTANFLRADGAWAAPGGGGATNLSWDAATRTLASDSGNDAVLTLVDIDNPGLAPRPETGPERYYAFTDFIGLLFGQDWQQSNSGTGAAFSSVGLQDGGTGWLQSALGTTATGRTFFGLIATGGLRFGVGAAACKARVRIATLSDATNSWTFRGGFIDSGSAESTDGAFFRYTHSVASGHFQAVTRNNNVETAVDTGITVAVGTSYRLHIAVNAAGTEAVFSINGSVVATITTNIPIAAGRETGAGLFCQRSTGTAALTAAFYDYLGVEQMFQGR